MVSPGLSDKIVHQGKNIKRIREILGIKQEVLAHDMGLSQQAVSQLEQKEALDQYMLEKVAKALKVSTEAILNFDEQAAINIISSTFNDYSSVNNNSTLAFNPIEKIVELYERLLQSEKEKVELLKSK